MTKKMSKQEVVVELGKTIEFLGWAERHAIDLDKAFQGSDGPSALTIKIGASLEEAYSMLNLVTSSEGPY